MNYNIDVERLDDAYIKCREINELITNNGISLINKMDINIDNLTNHWNGIDASNHINGIIDIYNELVKLVSNAKGVSSAVASSLIALQKIRQANGADGLVGSELDSSVPSNNTKNHISSSDAYKANYEELSTDYNDLTLICTGFAEFVDSFDRLQKDLLSNWRNGVGHDEAISAFNVFLSKSEEYDQLLNNAKTELSKVNNNIIQGI